MRFRDQAITFANGAAGENVDVPSASPVNYHQAISAPLDMPKLLVDGKLFLPPDGGTPLPLVILLAASSYGVLAAYQALHNRRNGREAQDVEISSVELAGRLAGRPAPFS